MYIINYIRTSTLSLCRWVGGSSLQNKSKAGFLALEVLAMYVDTVMQVLRGSGYL